MVANAGRSGRPIRVGIVGLGQITEVHRDGYRRFGIEIAGGYDVADAAKARFREQEPDARVFETVEQLAFDDDVDVIDLATHAFPDHRLPTIELSARAGKPILIQKPFALRYDEAVMLATPLEQSGVTAMVNQNQCFAGGVLEAAKAIVLDGAIGQPFHAMVAEHWYIEPTTERHAASGRWWTANLCVHALATLHLALGPPESVGALIGRDPAVPGSWDAFAHLHLRYPKHRYPWGLTAGCELNGSYYGRTGPSGVQSPCFQGDEGTINVQVGHGFHLTRRLRGSRDQKGCPVEFVARRRRWFPDAFGLTMQHLSDAHASQRRPLAAIEDALYVTATVEAAYRSSAERRVVSLEEIMGDRYDPGYGPGLVQGWHDWAMPEPRDGVRQLRSYDWN